MQGSQEKLKFRHAQSSFIHGLSIILKTPILNLKVQLRMESFLEELKLYPINPKSLNGRNIILRTPILNDRNLEKCKQNVWNRSFRFRIGYQLISMSKQIHKALLVKKPIPRFKGIIEDAMFPREVEVLDTLKPILSTKLFG